MTGVQRIVRLYLEQIFNQGPTRKTVDHTTVLATYGRY